MFKSVFEEEFLNRTVVVTVASPSSSGRRKPSSPKCATQLSYETYLENKGYSLTTPSGNDSTVYSYSDAVNKILDEERLTWNSLKNEISDVIKTYDAGVAKEDIGNKSNKTYINALKRFKDFCEA